MADEKNESKYKTVKDYDSTHNNDKYGDLPSSMAEEARKTDKGKKE